MEGGESGRMEDLVVGMGGKRLARLRRCSLGRVGSGWGGGEFWGKMKYRWEKPRLWLG